MLEKIKEIFGRNFDIDVDEITLESDLTSDLDVSSFQLLELLADIEQTFDIELETEEFLDVITVGDLIKCIEEHL